MSAQHDDYTSAHHPTYRANQTSRNQDMKFSAKGLDLIRRRERIIRHYYDDPAGNCTYGVGILAHHGHCTEIELQTPLKRYSDTSMRLQGTRTAVTSEMPAVV